MIEETLRQWQAIARKSGRRGWVLVKDGKIVGVFQDKKDAVMAAREPGVYLLTYVE